MKTTLRCRWFGHDLGHEVNGTTVISDDEVCRRRGCEYRNKDWYAPAWGESHVDLDRETIPLDDNDDPTSLLFQLTMSHGAAFVSGDPKTGTWTVNIDGKGEWTGSTQMEALRAAQTALEDSR